MKAIVLLSGGLDSSLALKLIVDQGIEAIVLHFSSPFCRCDGARACGYFARNIATQVGVKVKTIYLGESYLKIVKNPRHGYGKNFNPCIDCRILKFRKAKEVMQETGASFVVTGEVLGQRPMSQHKRAMAIIEKESGLEDLTVRPLSAKLLEPTLPERNGWINRDVFLSFQGRTRKPQIKLAEELDIKDYPCPAGGCLLTDASFAKRMRDLIVHNSLDLNNVELLKVGRHFRLSPNTKMIVGRNEHENNRVFRLMNQDDVYMEPVETTGPSALLRGQFDNRLLSIALNILARYCDKKNSNESVKILWKNNFSVGEDRDIVNTISDEEISRYRV